MAKDITGCDSGVFSCIVLLLIFTGILIIVTGVEWSSNCANAPFEDGVDCVRPLVRECGVVSANVKTSSDECCLTCGKRCCQWSCWRVEAEFWYTGSNSTCTDKKVGGLFTSETKADQRRDELLNDDRVLVVPGDDSGTCNLASDLDLSGTSDWLLATTVFVCLSGVALCFGLYLCHRCQKEADDEWPPTLAPLDLQMWQSQDVSGRCTSSTTSSTCAVSNDHTTHV